jgi:hypothetical protein
MMYETFKTSSESEARRERLWNLFARLDRGQLVTIREIEEATGFRHNDPTSGYWPIVKWLRRRHQSERGISIINQRLAGESLATHHEQLMIMPRQNKRARRAVVKGKNAAEALPYDELSHHQSMLKDSQIAEANEQVRKLRESKDRWNYLMRPLAPDPVRVKMADQDEESEKRTA